MCVVVLDIVSSTIMMHPPQMRKVYSGGHACLRGVLIILAL